ncbi:hypothetical protein DERF_006114 [Dermatophagoides farinae]|uniref:Uncharacterized protein n=1 Tax=Dermatophagoides farinae TaxID=6954 RepID=A0A922LBW7_DERFA|nr:hypothetical protein DERF_006114 [Dermatophagoides farinae]
MIHNKIAMYDEFGTIVCLDSGSGYFLYNGWNYCIVKLCGRNGDGGGGGFLLQHFYIIYMLTAAAAVAFIGTWGGCTEIVENYAEV